MKKKRCPRHRWTTKSISFAEHDKFLHYATKVESCANCNAERSVSPEYNEEEPERSRLLKLRVCKRCMISHTHKTDDCIVALAEKLNELDERLNNARIDF